LFDAIPSRAIKHVEQRLILIVALQKTLSEHSGVDAMWHFGSDQAGEAVERASIGNLKRTWVLGGKALNWFDEDQGEGREFLRHATQVKNIWIPYGE